MQNNFKFVGLSYKKASLDLRSIVSLDQESCQAMLKHIKEFTDATDVLVLSTCNRTEVYYASSKDHSEDIIKLIGIQKGIDQISELKDSFDSITDHDRAIERLYRVAIGLEAQVVGDMQITNQVKNAYQWSADLDMAGPFLHRLLHTIFFTNKRVVQETPFRDGAASVSYAGVELIEELAGGFTNPKVAIIGVGEMGTDVCKNLVGSSIEDVTIVNRTYSKAEALATECGFKCTTYDAMWDVIEKSDIIISSVSAPEAIITKDKVEALNILSHKFFIDIAVPRSVAKDVEEVTGALVYDIDNIQNKASEALNKRVNAVPQVESIIQESIKEFSEWNKEMVVSPTIQKLKNALEDIRKNEIARYVKQLSDDESEKVELITKNIMQKIIKLPVLQLKAACKRGEAETLIDVLNDLFNLEQEVEEEK